MGWGRTNTVAKPVEFQRPRVVPATVDWERLVTLDFETYWDQDYTLKKLSTSEYVRDARFKAQMVGIKIGSKPTRWYPASKIAGALRAIPWATHSFLGHHAQFDGLILFERFGVSPLRIYDTLSMARALYSNEIGAGLDDVSVFTGGQGKIKDVLELTLGVRDWPKALTEQVAPYCVRDVDETLRVFQHMLPHFPAEEIELIDRICRMFTEPVLRVDRPRVERELAREIAEKRAIMLSFVQDADEAGIKLTSADKKTLDENPSQEDIDIRRVKKLIGSQKFATLLEKEGVEPPLKVAKAWIDTPKELRDDTKKFTFAFAKTDQKFLELQEHLNPRVRALVEARLSVKSTTNETRAGRFLKASEGGAALPVYLKYSAAHTHRLGGGNKMNMQNLKRGGELRRSIQAPPGQVIVVVDSGQIEARTNGWLWGQEDLLENFRLGDRYVASVAHIPKAQRPVARGRDRDAYCKFGDVVYGREITTLDETERFVAKACTLGLGYQMGGERLQRTLALTNIFLTIDECQDIVRKYRKVNYAIKNGWSICQRIIEEMARGVSGSYKCIAWEKETIWLPNGMKMHYPNLHDKRMEKMVTQKLTGEVDPEFDPDWPMYVYDRKEAEVKIYGGALCENLVQALARIVVMGQSLTVARKYRMVLSTHDEGGFLAPKRLGEKAYQFALKSFQTPPAWAPDLPLNAEGGFDVVYSK